MEIPPILKHPSYQVVIHGEVMDVLMRNTNQSELMVGIPAINFKFLRITGPQKPAFL